MLNSDLNRRSQRLRPNQSWLSLAAVLALGWSTGAQAEPVCTFLMPLGGSGDPVVAKRVGPGRLLGRTNWNTDFIVDRPFTSYRFFFTATSTDPATYPVRGYMRFTDGASLRLFDVTISPPEGTGRMFGPFPAIPGRRTSLMNFHIGSSSQPGALGFSYRISVQGCN
ncbi:MULTISPECIES: hypothetical protein [Synechococcales]|uniref:hypothetical protein n=1 Tax=Synechococcus sp. CS-1325 TaxID=2847979 RepID=UPI00223B9A48|nr:hypothetical protein [Synechococcus sp. CS-1325]